MDSDVFGETRQKASCQEKLSSSSPDVTSKNELKDRGKLSCDISIYRNKKVFTDRRPREQLVRVLILHSGEPRPTEESCLVQCIQIQIKRQPSSISDWLSIQVLFTIHSFCTLSGLRLLLCPLFFWRARVVMPRRLLQPSDLPGPPLFVLRSSCNDINHESFIHHASSSKNAPELSERFLDSLREL